MVREKKNNPATKKQTNRRNTCCATNKEPHNPTRGTSGMNLETASRRQRHHRVCSFDFQVECTDRTAQYKLNAQSPRLFGLHRDVNDAHRAGANRLQNKNKIQQKSGTSEPLLHVATEPRVGIRLELMHRFASLDDGRVDAGRLRRRTKKWRPTDSANVAQQTKNRTTPFVTHSAQTAALQVDTKEYACIWNI